MHTQHLWNSQEIRVHLIGLLIECPYDRGNPLECPLYHFREKPIAERLSWLKGLSDRQLQDMYDYHFRCLEEKEGQILPGANGTATGASLHPNE